MTSKTSVSPNKETPPRMRGRHLVKQTGLAVEGNTPAYAGKTAVIIKKALENGKHPRVCGEDLSRIAFAAGITETPPRMRGRLRLSR